MANEYDPYRDALVMELTTIWPATHENIEPSSRRRLEEQLHAEPQQAAELEYVRQHTGFSRQITVTTADLERLGVTV